MFGSTSGKSSKSSKDKSIKGLDDPDEESQAASIIARNFANFFEKYERHESQDLIAHSMNSWLLSADEFKLPTEPPSGLISQMKSVGQSEVCILLLPVQIEHEEDHAPLDFREVNQICRELTMGIFVLNQLPDIQMVVNFDISSNCKMPQAYYDTRIGQLLSNVDYTMKCLWHGMTFTREKCSKFAERWRAIFDDSYADTTRDLAYFEFVKAGMSEITADEDYGPTLFDHIPVEHPADTQMVDDRKLFLKHADNIVLQMTFHQSSVKQHFGMFIVDADYDITTAIRLLDHNINLNQYDQLNHRLLLHRKVIKKNIQKKAETRRDILHLKLISFLIPFLVGMKRKMKVLELARSLPQMGIDHLKTDRDLPPMFVGPNSTCKNFFMHEKSQIHHIHGGIHFDIETPLPVTPENREFVTRHEEILQLARDTLNKYMSPDLPPQEIYPLPIVTIGGVKYHLVPVHFEQYMPPNKPRWIGNLQEELGKLKAKRIPLNDAQIHDQFKRTFGYKHAIRLKDQENEQQYNMTSQIDPQEQSVPIGLKAATTHGLLSVFQTMAKKCPPSRLSKQDQDGMALIHYAAMHDYAGIMAVLTGLAVDVNTRRNLSSSSDFNPNETSGRIESIEDYLSLEQTAEKMVKHANERPRVISDPIGQTSAHVAARCGALQSMTFLLATYANIFAVDEKGWAPIHHAAFFNHVPIIRLLIRKNEHLLEYETKNEIKATPLLLSANAGALSTLKCLISMGANPKRTDKMDNNIIHLAALRFHTNILEYFIKLNREDIPVWSELISMLEQPNETRQSSAVKCLEILTNKKTESHCKSVLDEGGIPALVNLLSVPNEEIKATTVSAICNLSDDLAVRHALKECGAGPLLINMLSASRDDVQSRAAVILSDLGAVAEDKLVLTNAGIVPPLCDLLYAELEDVLVNATNCIRVLCTGHVEENQTAVAENGAIPHLVEFLSVESETLKAAAAAAIAAMAENHKANQDAFVAEGAVRPIVEQLRGRNLTIQMRAAEALEALAYNNSETQAAFLELDSTKQLIRLLKIWSIDVKEQGACALWALSGRQQPRREFIADKIGVSLLLDMLLLRSEKLQFVGANAIAAFCLENITNQNKMIQQGAIKPMVRIIRTLPRPSNHVTLTVVKCIGTLCVGVAHNKNKFAQKHAVDEGAILPLLQLFQEGISEELSVECAVTLASIVLNNAENLSRLYESEIEFDYKVVISMLASETPEVRLRAGYALALFGYNNTEQQFRIREAGGLTMNIFNEFLQSENEAWKCAAAFQMVILARVIVDRDQVMLTASGINSLIVMISSSNDETVETAAKFISSLAHTRAGISDAMVTAGAIPCLIDKLYSVVQEVRTACAIALGYLTFNGSAHRILLSACRNTPGLYNLLVKNAGDSKISAEFVENFRVAKVIGLPSQSLEINGGPPVMNKGDMKRRIKSAPVLKMRLGTSTSRSSVTFSRRNRPNTSKTIP